MTGPRRFINLGSRSARRIAREVDDELRFHLEMRAAELREGGLSPDEARLEAVRRFGDVNDAQEYCRAMDRHATNEQLRRDWFADAWFDMRWSLRQMLRYPAFTFLAVITLGAGIGATTAIFSVVHRLLMNPIPVRGGDRIVSLVMRSPASGFTVTPSMSLIDDWRKGVTAFEWVGALASAHAVLSTEGDSITLEGGVFEPFIAREMGMRAVVGRFFLDDEALPGAAPVAMLGYGLWQRRFAGSRDAIGQVITVDGQKRTIVGVAPREFELPFFGGAPEAREIWWPLTRAEVKDNANGMAKLRPGATAAQAEREMKTLASAALAGDPFRRTLDPRAFRPQEFLGETTRDTLVVTLAAVGVLLLIACANVANLLLARAVSRQRELAIRTAVGAGRGRLVRQLLTESVLLALAGGAVGMVIAWRGLAAIIALRPDNLAALDRVHLDPRMLIGALALSLGTGIVFGIAPAWFASEGGLTDALKTGNASTGHRRSARFRSALVTFEVALSTMLLVGAGLLVRSFQQLQAVDVGVDPRGLVNVWVRLPEGRYPTPQLRMSVLSEISDRLRLVAGVRGVTTAIGLPGAAGTAFGTLEVEERSIAEAEAVRSVGFNAVVPDFFRTVGLPLREGTGFSSDRGSNEVVINATMAARYWSGGKAVGKRVRLSDKGAWMTIVGVVGDVRLPGAKGVSAQHQFYERFTASEDQASLLIRAGDGAVDLLKRVSEVAASVDPSIRISGGGSMSAVIAARFVRPRFALALLSTFAVVALFVASVGLYGVIAYSVMRRTREIGIRMALGARPRSVLRLVVSDGTRLGLGGLVLGLMGAAAGARVMRNLVFGIAPLDWLTFAAVAAILGAVTVAACYVPARRATRVDPLVAVRSD